MENIKTARQVLPQGVDGAVIFTKGDHLILHDDRTGFTGYWKVSRDRKYEKVILYHRNNIGNPQQNTIYVADFAGLSEPTENGRFKVNFINAKAVGISTSNWFEFSENKGRGPVKYLPSNV